MKKQKLLDKRINFLLNRTTIDLLDGYAKKSGNTKSKLIRTWINNPQNLKLTSNYKRGKDSIKFQLLLDSKTYQEAINLCSKLNINLSQFLRILIENNINSSDSQTQNNINNNSDNISKLWAKGKYNELASSATKEIDLLDNRQLYLLAKSNIQLSKFSKATDCIEVLKQRYSKTKDYKSLIEIKLLEIDIQLYLRNIEFAEKELKDCIGFVEENKLTKLAGKIYYCLADIGIIKEDNSLIEVNLENALDFLDIVNYPQERTELLMYLAKLKLWELDLDSAKKYLGKALNIIERTQNIYHYGWYYSTLASLEILKGCYNNAQESINKSITNYSESGTYTKDVQHNYEILSRLKLIKNQDNIDSVYPLLNKAIILEDSFRGNAKLSTAKLYKLFIQANHDYEGSINGIQRMITESKSTIKPETSNYILNATKYIYSQSESEISMAKMELLKLSYDGKFKLMRGNALRTLETRQIQMVVR